MSPIYSRLYLAIFREPLNWFSYKNEIKLKGNHLKEEEEARIASQSSTKIIRRSREGVGCGKRGGCTDFEIIMN